MAGKVTPRRLPEPRTALGYDGSDFHALKTDADGRLIARGEDQLFSFKASLAKIKEADLGEDDGPFGSDKPPEGEVWVITSVSAIDITSPTTEIIMQIRRASVNYYFHQEEFAKSAGRAWTVQCEKHLQFGDEIRVYFIGSLAGDTCFVTLTGYIMTRET